MFERTGSVFTAVVEVAKRFPTVNCVPVAMRLPEELVVTIEFMGSVAREEKGRLETVKVPAEFVNPVPRREVKSELFMNNDPRPNDPVVVALPTIVDDAVERKPFNKPMVVEVDTPQVCALNGQAKVLYPASLVNCETLAEAKCDVVNPETVNALDAFARPLPSRLLNELPFIIKFVVDAVVNDV